MTLVRVAGPWFLRWVKYRFRRKHELPKHTLPDKGVYIVPTTPGRPVVVAVLGDWGSGEPSAVRVAAEVERLAPDYTIHLGDIYYVGSRREVVRNCLGKGTNEAQWPRATGSFAVPGNHEYMSGGYGFFEKFLPTLGFTSAGGGTAGQETSYFCMDVGDWRLIGLDTGRRSVHYAGVELIVHLFSALPWVNRWKTWLPKQIVEWLREDVRLGEDDTRGLVLLSHHQFYTALDNRGDYSRPGHQIDKMLVRPRRVIWLWGHEHRFSAYEGQTNGGPKHRRLTVHGRAVGSSGVTDPDIVPKAGVLKLKKRIDAKRLTYADNRVAHNGIGYNGFSLVTIAGRTLTIAHHAVSPAGGESHAAMIEEFDIDQRGDVDEPRLVSAVVDDAFITPEWLRENLGLVRKQPPSSG